MTDANTDINQVDGIKKMSNEEKQKSREIILETIGEQASVKEEKKVKETEVASNISKKVDGIFNFANLSQASSTPEKQPKEIAPEKREQWRQEINKILPTTDSKIAKDVPADKKVVLLKPEVKQEKEIKKVVNHENKKVNQEKTPIKKHQYQKILAKKIKKDKTLLLSAKPEFIKPLSSQKLSRGSIFTLNEKNKAVWHRVEQRANVIVRQAIIYFFIFLAVSLLSYLILVLAVVRFNFDNPFFRSLSKFVLIPAIITEDGLIDFYSYQDIKNNLQLDDVSTKEEIIKNIVLADLYKRFKMSDQGLAGLEELQKNVVYDSAINQAPLERIKRIKDLIKNEGDFTSLATKYGDESGELSISSDKAGKYDFYNDVKQLELGEVSNIIYTAEGYYIFKNVSQDPAVLNLDYVFVRAKKIDDYLKETVKNYKYFSLVR